MLRPLFELWSSLQPRNVTKVPKLAIKHLTRDLSVPASRELKW